MHNRAALYYCIGFFFYFQLIVFILARFSFEGRLVSKGFILARFYFEGRLVRPRVPGLMLICTGCRRMEEKTQELLIV